MRLKIGMLVLCGINMAYSQVAATMVSAPTNVVRMTPEKLAAIVAKSGGFVIKPGTGVGKILIRNEQNRVPLASLEAPVEYLRKYTKLPIEMKSVSPTKTKITRREVRAVNANFLIVIKDDPSDESPLLVSPDCAWAVVNVAALAADNPKNCVLESRTRKELSRGFAFLCGGVNTRYSRTPVNACGSLHDLDVIDMDEVPADLIGRFKTYVSGYGVIPYHKTTYKAACKHGWAPAPTNDVQRAIWNDIHQLPTSPIKIKFDPKRDGVKK